LKIGQHLVKLYDQEYRDTFFCSHGVCPIALYRASSGLCGSSIVLRADL